MIADDPEREGPEGEGNRAFGHFKIRDRGGGVEEIARRLDELVRAVSEAPGLASPPAVKDGILDAARQARKARRERQRIFGEAFMSDSAWDILLELFIARIERRQVTVSAVSATIGASKSTMLRWAAQLIEAKLVASNPNASLQSDRQLVLTDEGVNLMCDYFIRTSPDLDAAAA
jgi:DNA-binding MarR family transcriptional regulator